MFSASLESIERGDHGPVCTKDVASWVYSVLALHAHALLPRDVVAAVPVMPQTEDRELKICKVAARATVDITAPSLTFSGPADMFRPSFGSLILRATNGAVGAAVITITLIGWPSAFRSGASAFLAGTALQVPTYTKDIGPLLSERCGMCHVADGSAPFSLLTYADAKRHATDIAAVTRTRYMPPWKADPDNGPFVGQHPLTDEEIDRIQQWVAGGAPQGDAGEISQDSAATTRRQQPSEWRLGPPDLIVTLPQPYSLQAEGTDVFRIFVIPLPVAKRRFVRGLEFRPGNPRVIHHANIRLDKTTASRALDEADPGPGYSGLILRSADYPEGHFLGWTPGQVAPLLPKDLSWRLDPRTDLVVETHMQPSGRRESVQPSIGLYFSDTPSTRTPAMLRLGRQNIDIPAGDPQYVVTDSYVLPVDVDVQAVQPHAHYRGRDIRGEAMLPDGTTVQLIHIGDWDFRWQHVFRFERPLHLRKGTTLSMRWVYDNSPNNPRNPERPPKRARWGQHSSDEMGDLWIQVLTRNETDLVTLTRQFRTKAAAEDVNGYEAEIERHPDDTGLHDDAALLYLEVGRPDAAVAHFQKSLALKEGFALAHYNLGTALAAAGRLDQAAEQYRLAIQIDPKYASSHNNLGGVLLAQGNRDEALREYREAVRLQPRSASGLTNLSWVLATGPHPSPRDISEAVDAAGRAARLTGPRDARTLDVLAAAYAAAGEFDRALDAAAAALRLLPAEPLASEIRQRLDLYRQRRPYTAPDPARTR
jgi:tetratricopeptide (TPR) repeat protein/mono/diheme cytochrome c family protein